MIRKTVFIPTLVLLFNSSLLLGQSMLQYIPNEAALVLGFNPASVNAKVDFNSLTQLDFYQDFIQEMSRDFNAEESGVISDAFNNPAQYGMDFNTESYFFIQPSDQGTFFTYVFRLSDPEIFADFFKNNLMNAEKGIRIQTENGLTTAITDEGFISWDNQVAMMTSAEINRIYEEEEDYYDWEDYEEEPAYEGEVFEEDINIKPGQEKEMPVEDWEWEDQDIDTDLGNGETDTEYLTRKKETLTRYAQRLFEIPADSALINNAKFARHLLKRNDVNLWMDYSFIQRLGMADEFSYQDPFMKSFMNAYQELYQDSYLSMTLNFDPGAVNLDSDAMMSPQWMNYLRASVDTKVNRKFKKYLKGENLLGYFFFNYNMENVLRGGKDLMLPILETIPMAGPMADDLLGILDIVVDEEAIYEFFKGDFCLAFTGMREFENLVTTYEFDEEFNPVEKEELKKQTFPEFVLMMSYGNEENLKKFFRLGEKSGGLENKGAYYEVPATAGMGMNLYAAYHKGILFFTNDTDLVTTNLNSGWAGKKRIAKEHRKLMKDHAQVFFWDIPKSLNSASSLGVPFGVSGDQIVNVSKQSLESVLMTAPKKIGESNHVKVKFRFANQQMNSLDQLFNFINEVYLTEKGETSM